MYKICPTCKLEKEITEFGKNKTRKDGLAVYCKSCASCKANKYYHDNPDKQKVLNINYKVKNPDKVNQINKDARNKHYKNNKEKTLIKNFEWRENNREYIRNYYREKRKNLDYRLKSNIRSRISMAVSKGGAIKESTKILIGCDIETLKQHLESKFKEGINWGNYGEWEIDHIIPVSVFDFTDIEQQKACFHYINLQPLWKLENLKKGCKLNYAA